MDTDRSMKTGADSSLNVLRIIQSTEDGVHKISANLEPFLVNDVDFLWT